MRILVVGAGATGGFYGARLLEAGRDVHFLVRPARAAALRENGLQLVSPQGDATLHPPVWTAPEISAPFDLVVLAVKAYGLEQAIEDLAPAVGPATLIVPILNGIRHIDLLAARFGQPAVLGGVSQVAATVDESGRIVQLNALQKLAYGQRQAAGPADPARLYAVHAALGGAAFEARLAQEIDREMWEKWVFLTTLGGINCLMRGTIGEIVAAPGGAALARQLLAECEAVAAASGQKLASAYVDGVARMITTPGSPQASSMFRDLQRGLDVEADHIVGDMLRRAQSFGLAAPLLAAAYASLCVYRGRRTAPSPAP
jgi:2-dehydropantoate 2-reductase